MGLTQTPLGDQFRKQERFSGMGGEKPWIVKVRDFITRFVRSGGPEVRWNAIYTRRLEGQGVDAAAIS
jgi:hypothetical protein